MRIIEAQDYKDMSRKAANIISAQMILKPESVIGLATGSTPIGVYDQLTEWYKKGDLDFSKIHTVNLDEYKGIDAENKQSYHYFMNQHLFSRVNIELQNTFVPDGMNENQDEECQRYEKLIAGLGGQAALRASRKENRQRSSELTRVADRVFEEIEKH